MLKLANKSLNFVNGLIGNVFFFKSTIIVIFDGNKLALIAVEILLCFSLKT